MKTLKIKKARKKSLGSEMTEYGIILAFVTIAGFLFLNMSLKFIGGSLSIIGTKFQQSSASGFE